MFLTRFIYNLIGHPIPPDRELDEEIDRLLCIKNAENPTYIVTPDSNRDTIDMIDSEVISRWIVRRFEPALILLILGSADNYHRVKSELHKMEVYKPLVSKFLRANFVERHALKRVKELCFDDIKNTELPQAVDKLKRTLTFLSKQLETHPTLQDTDKYTKADIVLYYYLKRVLIGKYKDSGLRNHVNFCQPLMRFMSRFANKNQYVVDVTRDNPLGDTSDEPSLVSDITKPAIVAIMVVLFYLWRKT